MSEDYYLILSQMGFSVQLWPGSPTYSLLELQGLSWFLILKESEVDEKNNGGDSFVEFGKVSDDGWICPGVSLGFGCYLWQNGSGKSNLFISDFLLRKN